MAITRRRFILSAAACGAVLTAQGAAAPQAPMLNRPVPSSKEMLPVIGLGTADTFDVQHDDASLAPLAAVLAALLDAGGRVVDTAPSYGNAEATSGTLLARAHARQRVFLATKISASGHDAAMRQIHASQRALRSDRLDLIQVHNLIDTDNQLALLRDLKQEGVTRYIGITHYLASAHDALIRLVEREQPDFVQVNLSVAEREAEQRLLPACQAHGVAVLINRPFQDGRLFRLVRGQPLPDWAAEIDCSSWAQIFLKFIIGHPAVTAVIPATSKPANMVDNALAGRGRIPDVAMRARIAALFA